MNAALMIFVTIYLMGAVCGGLLAFWRHIQQPIDQKDTLHGAIDRFEKSFMWTVFWWFCLAQWFVSRREGHNTCPVDCDCKPGECKNDE